MKPDLREKQRGQESVAFFLIRNFRGRDTGLGHQVKLRKRVGQWTGGVKCGGIERVKPVTES